MKLSIQKKQNRVFIREAFALATHCFSLKKYKIAVYKEKTRNQTVINENSMKQEPSKTTTRTSKKEVVGLIL